LLALAILVGCSDDKPAPENVELPPVIEKKTEVAEAPPKSSPVVYIEELDQYQEYFKEQHETSFSHVTKKNWSSFTAGKDGILTKVMLFGKPNYTISEHYGKSMSGFIRANNPDTGPKYGEWSITREEIVNQLAIQGLTEIDRGWITLQMRGEIPQQKGKLYFIVCDKIEGNRGWFGAFAFAEGNSYKNGRFWLHPEHDLVFRTYVGKTADQLEKEQKGEPLFHSDTASLVPAKDIPESPKPMIELSKNFQVSPSLPQNLPTQKISPIVEDEPLYQPATEAIEYSLPETLEATQKEAPKEEINSLKEPPSTEENKQVESDEETPNRSLFERFFKKSQEK
jgi:hypothetical protein